MKKILTIAGSDPSGGAGMQKDLAVFTELGAYGLSAVTAVTSQNTRGVKDSQTVPASVLKSQLACVFEDLPPDAVKTGMLGSRENAEAVYEILKKEKVGCLVVDPVLKSSSGYALLEEDALAAMRKLMEIATICTPNVREAEILSRVRITCMEERQKAAEEIGDCVITGGDEDAKDLLYYRGEYTELAGAKKDARVHGTGCMFSSALTVYLADGISVPEAVGKAKAYTEEKIIGSLSLGAWSLLADTVKDGMSLELEAAIRAFTSLKDSVEFAPEVGVNIAYALPGAQTVNEVYGLTGRIVKAGRQLIPVGEVKRAGSNHVARIVLTAMKHDPGKRAAMNVRYSPETVEACVRAGLSVSSFDREKQPADTPTMEWGTNEAIKSYGSVPDCVYDTGAVGKEAMIRILAETPEKIVEKVTRIIQCTLDNHKR